MTSNDINHVTPDIKGELLEAADAALAIDALCHALGLLTDGEVAVSAEALEPLVLRLANEAHRQRLRLQRLAARLADEDEPPLLLAAG